MLKPALLTAAAVFASATTLIGHDSFAQVPADKPIWECIAEKGSGRIAIYRTERSRVVTVKHSRFIGQIPESIPALETLTRAVSQFRGSRTTHVIGFFMSIDHKHDSTGVRHKAMVFPYLGNVPETYFCVSRERPPYKKSDLHQGDF